jgi:hypothetical protein
MVLYTVNLYSCVFMTFFTSHSSTWHTFASMECTYICVCMYVCMYFIACSITEVILHASMYVCMYVYVCVHVCMCSCMHVCICVYVCVYVMFTFMGKKCVVYYILTGNRGRQEGNICSRRCYIDWARGSADNCECVIVSSGLRWLSM